MTSATINVKFLNEAKPGKKNASVKTDTDDFYLVPLELVSQISPGGTYKIEYNSSAFRGVTYKYIEKIEAASPPPSPVAKHQANKYGVTDDTVAERIFVSGILQRAVAASQSPLGISEDMLVEQVNKLRSVWHRTFGNPQRDNELNDAIPY